MEVDKKLKYLQLEQEIDVYRKMMSQATEIMLDQDVSEYPIFIFHQQTVEIGIPAVRRENVSGNWSVNVSTFEEFVSKQLIEENRIESFQAKLDQESEKYCLFVLSELGSDFVFFPKEK